MIDRLLPWFVNDTLNAGERDSVRHHLESCDECRENVSLLTAVQTTVRHSTATPMVRPQNADRLLARINDLEGQKPTNRWMSPAIILAASLGAVVMVATLLLPGRMTDLAPPGRFETATSTSRQGTMDYVLRLEFRPGTKFADQQRILRDLQAEDIRHDTSTGVYNVNISLAAASLEELERFTGSVQALPEVRSARIVALQLPLQRQQ